MKTCSLCLERKENNRFDRNDASIDGFAGVCKTCRLIQKKYREARKASLNINLYLLRWAR